MVGNSGKGHDINARATGRKALLTDYVNKRVTVITNDGRNIVGLLRGFDQVCNVILEQSHERVFVNDGPVQIVSLGLYVIRGDNIAVVGDVDAEKDDKIEWEKVKVRTLDFERCPVSLIICWLLHDPARQQLSYFRVVYI